MPAARRSDVIYAHLSSSIAAGELAVGDRIPSEAALAEQMGVARTGVREAISRLAAEGILVTRHGSGTFVARTGSVKRFDFTPVNDVADLLNWHEFRIGIESENAMLAAQRREDSDVAKLREIHAALEAIPGRSEKSLRLDHEFHLAIAKATKNDVIVRVASSFNEHIRNFALVRTIAKNLAKDAYPREHGNLRANEHLAIIEAIERFDPVAASLAARRHLENGRTRLLASLSALSEQKD